MDEGQQGASAPSTDGASASTSATVTPWQGQGSRPLANEVPAGQMYQAGNTAAPIAPLVSSSSSSSSLAAAMPSPSPRTNMPSPSMIPPALTTSSSNGNGQKPKSAPEKRVLPARLRRVSALLGGESLDDANSPGGREESPFQRSLPDSTILVISKRDQDAVGAYEAPADEEGLDSLNFFQDPKMVMACREKALIETPDFKLREDSSQMGKTRGGAMRSEEDTSDAAYERRHRRPDNLEKKQRRMEKERLIKERQRLRDRIEQLKTADPRMLMPIMSARESQLPSSSTTASSLRGAEAAIGLGKQHMSAEATNNLNKIEKLRKELIAETTETLARYDAVLSVAVPVVEAPTPTAAAAGTSSSSSSSRSKVTKAGSPSTSTSTATKRRASSSGGASTPPPRKPRTSSSSAASPSLLSEPEIMVKAENEHRNIHARTSGGRFAPRSAVIDPNDPEAGYKPARKPRPSEIAKRAQKEAERQARAAGLLPPKKRGTSKGKGGAAGSPGAMDAATMAAAAAALQARAANRVGPSLAEIDTAERRPKRVRLLLGQRPGTETEDDDSQEAAAAAAAAAAPRFAAPGALSLEQAQKMMMAAMAAARGGPAADAAGEAAVTSAAVDEASTTEEVAKAEPSATDAVNETDKPAAAAPSTAESVQPEQAAAAPQAPDTTMDSATGAPSTTVDSTTIDGVPTTSSTSSNVDASAAPIEPIPSTSTATTTTDSTTAATTETQTYRRTSSRIRGAFGEKLPQRAFQQEDFETVLVREGVVSVEISVAERQQVEEKQKGEQGGDVAMVDGEKGKEAEAEKAEAVAGGQQQVAAAPQPDVAPQHTTEPSTSSLPAQPLAATTSSADLMDVDEYVNADAFNGADQ